MSTDNSRPERVYRPGDRALVLFGDGVRRPATLSDGFAWVADGNPAKVIFAEGGFDAEPAPRPERVTLTDEERFDLIEQAAGWYPTQDGIDHPEAWAVQVAGHAIDAFAPILAAREQVTALLDKEVAENVEDNVRAELDNVRCWGCNLRYAERDQYGCGEPGRAHNYDAEEIADAEASARADASEYVTLSVAALRAALRGETQ